MLTNRIAVESFLQKVFPELPVTELNSFITSALFDLRRAMATRGVITHETPLLPEPPLPRWLASDYWLPPWEAELLAKLFSERPILLLQGGSGSGKTSSLAYLRLLCLHLAKERQGKVPSQSIPYILYIDFQVEAAAMSQYDVEDASVRERGIEVLFAYFLEQIDLCIKKAVKAEALPAVFSRLIERAESADDTLAGNAGVVLEILSTNYRSTPPSLISWAGIKNFLSQDLTSTQRLTARYFFLQAAGEILWEHSQSRIVVAVDNIDPLPEYMQTALIQTLSAVAYSHASALNAGRPSLSVALFARFSTSSRQSGALDGVQAKKMSFRSPDTSDLIFYRITEFLLDSSRHFGWTDLLPSDQAELLARSWLLWERLADPRGQFSKTLAGLAGMNGRTASKLARNWLLSSRLSSSLTGYVPSDGALLSGAVAASILLRLAHALARYLRSAELGGDLEGFTQSLCDHVFRQLLAILIGHRLIRRAHGRSFSQADIRQRLSERLREDLGRQIRSDLSASNPLASTPLALAAFDLSGSLSLHLDQRSRLRLALRSALQSREAQERHRLSSIVEEDRELAQDLFRWLANAMERGVGSLDRRSLEVNLGDALRNLVPADRRTSNNVPSRWETISILVSPDSAFRRTPTSALNLFSADSDTISPVALHVLCYLQEVEIGEAASVLRDYLVAWGFSRRQYINALDEMVAIDKRLIYSRVVDHGAIEKWFEGSHRVNISSAGTGYLDAVSGSPAYLQWALVEPRCMTQHFGGIDAIKARSSAGLSRIELVLEGLQVIRKDEIRRRKSLPREIFREGQRSLSPVSWVFFGCLDRFIVDLSGFRDSAGLAERFLAFGRQLLDDYRQFCGAVPEQWESQRVNAEHEFQIRFGRTGPRRTPTIQGKQKRSA